MLVSEAGARVLEALCPPAWQARQDRDGARELIQQIMALHEHTAPECESADELTSSLLGLRMWALGFMNNLRDSAAQAILIGEPLLADSERILGARDSRTLNTGNDLATAYRASGRIDEAIQMQERIVDECESDIERTDVLYTSVLVQMWQSLAGAAVPAWTSSPRTWQRSWLLGFATAVIARVRAAEQHAAAEATAPQAGAETGAALVLADRKQVISRAVQKVARPAERARPSLRPPGHATSWDHAPSGARRAPRALEAVKKVLTRFL